MGPLVSSSVLLDVFGQLWRFFGFPTGQGESYSYPERHQTHDSPTGLREPQFCSPTRLLMGFIWIKERRTRHVSVEVKEEIPPLGRKAHKPAFEALVK